MADLATPQFFAELKAMYPAQNGASGAETVLSNPWYIFAAVAFSASNKPAAVASLFEFVLAELKAAQSAEADAGKVRAQRLHLARRFREALLKSWSLAGGPRCINSIFALNAVLTDELRDTQILRNTNISLHEAADIGRKQFRAVYRDSADSMQALLDKACPDLGWTSTTVGYGLTYGGSDLVSPVEISFLVIAALIAMDVPRALPWHMNATHSGATLEEVKGVRQISILIAEKAGIRFEGKIPEMV